MEAKILPGLGTKFNRREEADPEMTFIGSNFLSDLLRKKQL